MCFIHHFYTKIGKTQINNGYWDKIWMASLYQTRINLIGTSHQGEPLLLSELFQPSNIIGTRMTVNDKPTHVEAFFLKCFNGPWLFSMVVEWTISTHAPSQKQDSQAILVANIQLRKILVANILFIFWSLSNFLHFIITCPYFIKH